MLGMLASLSLGTLDWVVLVVCAVLAVRGATRGFMWQAIRTLGLVGGIWVAGVLHRSFGVWVDERVPFIPTAWTPIAAWLGIVVGVFMIATLFAWMARGVVRDGELTTTDRTLGFVMGGVMGLAIMTIALAVYGHVASVDKLRDTIKDSVAAKGMARLVHVAEPLVPGSVRDRFEASLEALKEAGE